MATVAATPRFTTITLASASAGPFEIGFRIFSDADLRLFVDDVLTEDFTVSALFDKGYSDGATFSLLAPADAGTVLRIESILPAARGDDYLPSDPGLTRKMNEELGRSWSVLGDIRRDLARAPKIPPSFEGLADPALPPPDPDRVLVARADGHGWEHGPLVSEILATQEAAEAAIAAAAILETFTERTFGGVDADGRTGTYAIAPPLSDVTAVEVFYDGVRQEPFVDYAVVAGPAIQPLGFFPDAPIRITWSYNRPVDDAPVTQTGFASRADFLSMSGALAALPNGSIVTAGGLAYRRDSSATAIADLPGWVPDSIITPLHFGADGSGVTNDAAAVTAANAYAVAKGSSVVITGGTFSTTSAINFTAPVVFESGGVLKPTSTVTFTATLEAGNWQIFDLTNGGSIVASGRVVQVNALWWGLSQEANTATATANASAINNALKTRRPVIIPTTSPNRSTGWPVLSGTIIITDADTAISGAPGAKTLLNQYGTGHLFTIRASYHTCEWIEVRGDRDTTGDTLVNNLTDGFPWFLDTATQPIIQQIAIRDCRTYNTWGVAADAKSGTAGNVPKQWFISDIEADLLRGPGFDMADVNGSLFLDNIGIGRGSSSRSITIVADAGGGNVVFTTSVPHGFVAAKSVGIAGTTNYNGAKTIIATPTPWTFTVAATYVAETLSGATASSFVSHFDHPTLYLANNAGANFRNCNFIGTSEDFTVAGTLISYPNQHGMDLDNVVSASFDGIYCDHNGGIAFRANNSYNLKGTRMHLGYAGSTNMHLLAVTRSRFHVEWLRGIPAASGGAPNIDGILMNSGCQDVTVFGGSALNITGHAFNVAGDRCSIFDWSLENITGDGLRYSAAASGISSNIRFRNAPTSGVYARNLGSATRVLNVERETGTFDNLCHVAALTTPGTGSTQLDGPTGVGTYTVATRPTAATHPGREIYVSDLPGGARRQVSIGGSWVSTMTASDIPLFTGAVIYDTRADAVSAIIPAGQDVLSLYHRGQLLHYKRDATGTAIQTADGQWWSPADIPTVDHWATPVTETDDASAAIAAANNWVAANGGGDLLFNAVRYQINTPLVLTTVEDVTWRGQGLSASNTLRTTLYLNTGASDALVIGDAALAQFNFKMIGFRLAHDAGMTGWTLRLLNLNHSRVEHVRVAGGYNGIRVENANNLHFEHVTMASQTGIWGFYLLGDGGSGIDVVTFKHCNVSQTMGTETINAYVLDGDVATIYFHDCRAVRVNRGLWVQNTTATPSAKTLFVYGYGFEIDFPVAACMRLDVGEYFNFYGTYLHGSGASDNVVIEDGVKEVHFFGGKITSAYNRGLWIKGQRISLTDVSVATNSLSAYGTVDGIYIDTTAQDVRIIGGRSNPGGSINSQRYGVFVTGGAQDVTIIGCDLSGNLTGAINSTFTAGQVKVAQCSGIEWLTVGGTTYANDATAAAAGVPIGAVYRTSTGAIAWRQV